MTWLSYVFALLVGAGYVEYARVGDRQPLAPWDRVGADPFEWVVNYMPDTVAVFAQSPQVDGAFRYLGLVPPNDSVMVKLPYADAEVLLRVAVLERDLVRLNIYAPGVGRVSIHHAPPVMK